MSYKKIGDFGGATDVVVRTVARHLYDRELAARIERNVGGIRLAYSPYDWRLNR